MTEHKISLSDSLNNFVENQVKEGGYADVSEYISNLLNNTKLKSLPRTLSDVKKLDLFNKKCDRLERYKLWEYLDNNPEPSVKISRSSISNSFPDQELIEAPLITMRLFMQDNDYISVRNMQKVYDKNILFIPSNLTSEFSSTRNQLNKFLDENSLYSISSSLWISEHEQQTTKYTNREILEALLYGEIAHFTQREDYQTLYNAPIDRNFNLMQCMGIIRKFKDFLCQIREINKKAITYLPT